MAAKFFIELVLVLVPLIAVTLVFHWLMKWINNWLERRFYDS